jgi:isopentenyl-diphosphate delta-isomerase type 1
MSDLDETLDLVDESDQIIGEVGRTKAHSNPDLIHREIGILILDEQKRPLFTKRSQFKQKNPGCWNIGMGGHIRKGEAPGKAAKRELFEELGLKGELKFFGKWFDRTETEARFFYQYVYFWRKEKISIDQNEVEEVRFLNRKEYKSLLNSGEKSSPSTAKLAEDYFTGSLKYEN